MIKVLLSLPIFNRRSIMKISLKKGMNVYESLQLVKSFLLENCSDYTVLKNDMNIYVTLTNREDMVCPYNEMDYSISENEIHNVQEEKKELAKNCVFKEFKEFVEYNEEQVQKYRKQYDLDLNYIKTAKEKNRKEEKIKERKLKMQENKIILQGGVDLLDKILRLEEDLQNREVEFILVKSEGSKKYNYYFRYAIHFKKDGIVFDPGHHMFHQRWKLENYLTWCSKYNK